MKPLSLTEAAQFLRMSRSSLYQRKDIPRYRRPGSRVMLFDQEELETWLKRGRIEGSAEASSAAAQATTECSDDRRADVVDIQPAAVYHRNARYR
jgi:predicted DNA-binding transcriptional regulator AlpA